mgnify:CR=1 FL=1
MTRRERVEARLERRRAWATSAGTKANQVFNRVHQIADGIPFGQPILVGHHSEGHARRDAARIDAGMRKGCEITAKAEHHAAKARGIADQLDRSIYSDDPDATEALDKRAADAAKMADRMIETNRAWRKGKGTVAGMVLAGLSQEWAERVATKMAGAESYIKAPFEPYQISLSRAAVKRARERIAQIKRDKEQWEEAKAAGGVIVKTHGPNGKHTSITWADYPGREMVKRLKAAGFRWVGPYWIGSTSRVEEVDIAR